MNSAAGALLAPSELALLHGEQFAPQGNWVDKTTLLHLKLDVSANRLAHALLLVAVLANEQANAIRLEARQKSAPMGLTKSQALYADPVGAPPAWPALSLEAQVRLLAEQLYAKKQNDVYTLVYTLLQHDTANPWQSLIEMVKASLARRGQLQAQEKKQFLAAPRVQYTLPQSTAELAGRLPIAPLQQWLADSERGRPDLFKLLTNQIESGLKRRVEQSTSV